MESVLDYLYNNVRLSQSCVRFDTRAWAFISGITDRHITLEDRTQWLASDIDNCSCCCELQATDQWPDEGDKWAKSSRARRVLRTCGNRCVCAIRCVRRSIKKLVEHKYFQQGILLAILINTLSMGIEYHNQVSVLSFCRGVASVCTQMIEATYVAEP